MQVMFAAAEDGSAVQTKCFMQPNPAAIEVFLASAINHLVATKGVPRSSIGVVFDKSSFSESALSGVMQALEVPHLVLESSQASLNPANNAAANLESIVLETTNQDRPITLEEIYAEVERAVDIVSA